MTSSSEEDSEEDFIFTITNLQKQPTVTIQIGGIPVSLIVYSGSSVNLINNDTFEQLQSINQLIEVIFYTTVFYKQHQTTATFNVTKSSPQGLLSYKTSLELGVLTMEINNHIQQEI